MLADQVPYYILDLLQQSPSVQVPGLGRFDAIFHPAVMDIPGARVSPPYIEPDFHGAEESADEFLAAYIRYATGKDAVTVSRAIHDFVKKVHTTTTEAQPWPIEKFGTFSRSASGQLRFTPDWDAFNLSFSGLEVIDLKTSPDISRPSVPDTSPKSIHTSEPEPVFTPEVIEPSSPELPVTISPVHLQPEILPVTDTAIDENTSRLWWMILISAIVLITILCAYLAWDIISNRHRLDDIRQVSADTMGTARVDIVPPAPDSSPATQGTDPAVDVVEQQMDSPEEPESQPISQEEPCYIIVGAFGDPANVTRMMDRLTTLGYTAEEIKGASLTKVAIRTSCDNDALQTVLNEARTSINPEAWIY